MASELIRIDKVTLNCGVGAPGQELENARVLLERISGHKAIYTQAKDRNPTFKIRKGDNIGTKVTIRGPDAAALLKKALEVPDHQIPETSFDDCGNVAFGIKEYIDFPGIKYDPKIGMLGFDVCITLVKKGVRVQRRKISPKRLPRKQRVGRKEAQDFMAKNFAVKVTSKAEEEQ
ncbi:MAG: 50S ribosomal protein L5 [Candidatus Micrarchaeia archaeon]|jgi:large subunit ribosomal protein L5